MRHERTGMIRIREHVDRRRRLLNTRDREAPPDKRVDQCALTRLHPSEHGDIERMNGAFTHFSEFARRALEEVKATERVRRLVAEVGKVMLKPMADGTL